MPKGFLPLWFFFLLFYSTPNLRGHWADLSQTWTRIHLWLLFENFGPNSLGIYPHGLGSKRFLDRLWNLTEHISATKHDINNWEETCQSTGTPDMPYKFGELWSRNGWERLASFCSPPKFSHWDILPALPHGRYITDSRQTLASVM